MYPLQTHLDSIQRGSINVSANVFEMSDLQGNPRSTNNAFIQIKPRLYILCHPKVFEIRICSKCIARTTTSIAIPCYIFTFKAIVFQRRIRCDFTIEIYSHEITSQKNLFACIGICGDIMK